MRTYFVAWYRFRGMRAARVAVVRDKAQLPTTCYAPVHTVRAHSMQQAKRKFLKEVPQ